MMKIENKKAAVALTAISLLLILAGLAYAYRDSLPCFCDQTKEKPQLIGGDKDEHGCLIAAGYSWCEEKNKCLRTWEEACVASNTPGKEITENSAECKSFQPESCPAQCVVCPPCPECSSISCQSEDFCRSLGIDRSWYEKIKEKLNSGSNDQGGDTVCTMDAKECPDGSFVGRSGPNCEFAACPENKAGGGAGMANPASVYCEERGGKLDIRIAADGSQTGFCVFPNGKECDEWAFFRGECKP